MTKSVYITFRATPDEARALKHLAAFNGRSRSAELRLWMAEHFEKALRDYPSTDRETAATTPEVRR
ncbi:MAG: hypothetical protein M3383_02460 [Actinomycetota bacterium]|nr:hypothetical protein [Actinomycetota bacterium]